MPLPTTTSEALTGAGVLFHEDAPLRNRTWLPLVFIALLTAEWLLRRRLNLV